MNNLAEFFHMGGYALYVWGAYGLATVVLSYDLIAPSWRLRGLKRRLALRHTHADSVSQP